MSTWIVAVAGLMVGAGFAEAQEWASSLNAGLNLTDGNSETLNLNVGIAAERGDDDNHTKLSAEYSYGETDKDATVDNVKASAEQRSVLTGDTYGYGTASFLADDIADIDYRFIVGAGVGQYLVRNDATTLGVELGIAWVTEDVGETDDFFALRVGQNLAHQISENAKLFESVEYLPEFEDVDNYLIHAEVGIEAAINTDLALRVVLQDRYDSTPAPDREYNDLSLIAGLSYAL